MTSLEAVTRADAEARAHAEAFVAVDDLRVRYRVEGGRLPWRRRDVVAVDGVSFAIPRGRTLGLVGESGCGKTTLARALLRLTPAAGGAVRFDGVDVLGLGSGPLKALRRRMQIVYQDPYSSLNPRLTIERHLTEPLRHALGLPRGEARSRAADLLERVGLSPARGDRYPHEFSGGERQRVAIARALATNPDFVVLDEPTSALDVSVQAQVLNLLKSLQKEFGLTYLFISHDLSVVRHMGDSVAVMYLGRFVEEGPVRRVFESPKHPYTRALLSAVPHPDLAQRHERIILGGEVPSALRPPPGCRFHPRCPIATQGCQEAEPELEDASADRRVACFHA